GRRGTAAAHGPGRGPRASRRPGRRRTGRGPGPTRRADEQVGAEEPSRSPPEKGCQKAFPSIVRTAKKGHKSKGGAVECGEDRRFGCLGGGDRRRGEADATQRSTAASGRR